jgi:hypothetical protein
MGVYKTKYDSKGNVKRFKARLVAKVSTQRKGINYNETFSLVSSKDPFRIIMALVAHFKLELHQMDIKREFLNGDLNKNVYMTQQEGFVIEGKEYLACRLKKLWLEASFKTVVPQVRQDYCNFWFYRKYCGQLHLCQVYGKQVHNISPVCG